MIELGKTGKHLGQLHPRDLRKLDPSPPPSKLPGKSPGGSKASKVFGFKYKQRRTGAKRWRTITHWSWYATEKQRDQAMRTAGHYLRAWYEVRDVTPIRRGDL